MSPPVATMPQTALGTQASGSPQRSSPALPSYQPPVYNPPPGNAGAKAPEPQLPSWMPAPAEKTASPATPNTPAPSITPFQPQAPVLPPPGGGGLPHVQMPIFARPNIPPLPPANNFPPPLPAQANSTHAAPVGRGISSSVAAQLPAQNLHSGMDFGEIMKSLVATESSDVILTEHNGIYLLRRGSIEFLSHITTEFARELFLSLLQRVGTTPSNIRTTSIDTFLNEAGLQFRVSAFTDRKGGRAVMRVLNKDIPDPDAIFVPSVLQEIVLQITHGLVLICGPTGSGKTTTIASLLQARGSKRAEHVITLEDPVEYIMPSDLPTLFTQREVGRDEVSYARGLRAAMRQAPHVIVIGEIRDADTASIALEAAETGHVVIATIHSSSVEMTPHRFLQMIPAQRQELAKEQLASNIGAIMVQRLWKVEKGYRGRIPSYEVMIRTAATANCIRKEAWVELRNEIGLGAKKGHVTVERSLKTHLESDNLSLAEYESIMERINGVEQK